eukprot:UN20564
MVVTWFEHYFIGTNLFAQFGNSSSCSWRLITPHIPND